MSDPIRFQELTERAFVPPQANGTSGLPNGIVVLMRNTCPHCHSSMQATGYPTQINGVPVTWLNINDTRSESQLKALGVKYEWKVKVDKNGQPELDEKGKEILIIKLTDTPGVPTVLRVQDGVAKEVLRVGAFDQPTLDAMGAAVKAQETTTLSVITNAPDTLSLPAAARSSAAQLG